MITFDDATVCLYNKENFEINSNADTATKLRQFKEQIQALDILEKTEDYPSTRANRGKRPNLACLEENNGVSVAF